MNEPQRETVLSLLDWHNRVGALVFAVLLGIVAGVFGGLIG